jgi:methylated-DNA-[protein]-cysteine S-methyltransferase
MKNSVCANLQKQVNEYIKGTRKVFDLKFLGINKDLKELSGTPFQKRVWIELLRIPYGKVVTYQYVADSIGKPKAVRAVASAIAANPLHILIPCHRVLPLHPKRKGDVGQYAGGVEVKRMLLDIESKVI